jgi:outer membrane murein-binding lipoprotein Lpp
MKKLLALALLGAGLVLSGCVQQVPADSQNLNQAATNQNQQINQPAPAVEQDTSVTTGDEQNQNIQSEKPASQLFDNWKTYTNIQEKYSVTYPSNLIVYDNNPNQITIGSPAVPYINITTYQSKGNTDLQSFVQEKLIGEFNGLLTANEIKWITIDNDFTKIGVKFPSKAGGYNGELYWVYIGHNYKVYKIAILTDYNDMTQNEFQDKIMSSFKFLD